MKLKLPIVLFLFTNLLLATTDDAPPSNDDFANAIPITCGNTYLSSTLEATIDENNAPDATSPQVVDLDAPNIWYTYTGSGTPETVTLDLCASGYDTSYLVYTGTSGNLTLVAANDFNTPVCGAGYRSYGTFESDGTTTYYITITGYNATDIGSVDLTVSCEENLPTPNTIGEAIPITPSPEGTGCDGGNYTFNLDFTNSGTTDSGLSGCTLGDVEGLDQFFTWTATANGLQYNTPSFSGRAGMIIRNANAPYDVIDCTRAIENGSAIFTGWNIGDNLIIQVYKTQGQTGTADAIFCLEEKTIVTPPNNTPAGAIPITPGAAGSNCTTTSNNQTIFFNTDTYTTTDSGTDTNCIGDSTGVDQFFTWTATATGLLWGQNPANLGIAVRSTSGIEYGCVVRNLADPIKLSGWQLGEDLIIQIFNYENYHYDSIPFCLREYNTSPNDLISGAIPIIPGGAGDDCSTRILPFSTDGTTDSGLDGTCNGINTGNDQFFTWTATTNALLWSGLTENPGIIIRDPGGNEITCADTIAPDNTVLSGWQVGDDLIIQIYDWAFDYSDGTFPSNAEQSYRDVSFCLKEHTIVPPAITFVPDDNFEQALIDLGYDDVLDDGVLTSNINTILSLNVDDKNILDLTGIEDFTSLEELRCERNGLTSLDVSQNLALRILRCGRGPAIVPNPNQITSLDVSQNILLETLVCDNNPLGTLDVSQNVNLVTLNCLGTNLTSLNVTPHTNLEYLTCGYNSLTSLDISQNTQLKYLYLIFNQLTTLNVSNNPLLETLYTGSNPLTSLDVSGNLNLSFLWVSNTQLTSLDISNNPLIEFLICAGMSQLIALNVANGANEDITSFSVFNNPNLSCVQVDNVAYSTANWNEIDSGLTFSTDCNYNANDDCVDAIPVPISDAACNNTVSGTLAQSTNSNAYNCFNSTNFSDVWFSFVATETTHNIKTLNTSGANSRVFHAVIDAQTYNCGNITDAIYCTDDVEGEATGLTIGNTYYIQVYTDALSSTETFDVCVSTTSIPGQTYVPDDNFEQALIDLGLDTTLDNYVTTANINTVNDLNIRNLGIFDLTGIEDFAGLEILNCGLNLLGELDLSNNTNLNYLIADNAALTELNVKNGNNTNVTTFVTLGNVDLFCIEVDDAAYSTANWTIIEAGTSFSENCGEPENDNCANAISVPVSDGTCNNTVAGTLLRSTNSGAYNCFGSTDFSDVWYSFVATETTHNIKTLNTSGTNSRVFHAVIDAQTYNCGNITDAIYCTDDVEGQATGLTIGNTYYIQVYTDVVNTTETFDLCVSTNSVPGQTYVPDDNFEQALIDLGYDTVLDDYVTTANINTETFLNITNRGITSLVGIEDFAALSALDFSGNNVTTVDLSQNTQLEVLLLTGNQLATIDVSQNSQLTNLTVEDNLLSAIDVSQNSLLQTLNIEGNSFSSIDLTQNSALSNLNVKDNSITQIDLTQNPALEFVTVDDNNLSSLDVSNNPILRSLSTTNNSITTIDLTQNPALVFVYLGYNQLTTIDVSQNLILEVLDVTGNTQISSIDVAANLALRTLRINFTQIPNVNVSNNLNLEDLSLAGCPITAIDVSANVALQSLGVVGSQIINIDLSQNPAFARLFCSNTSTLNSINIQNGNNTNILTFIATNTPNLTCVQVDDVAYSTANWTNVDVGINFSTNCGFPANDICVNAISVPVSDATCNNTVSGTLAQATNSGAYHCFGNSAGFSDVWYSFVATETTHNIKILNSSGTNSRIFHAVIDAQTYTCGNITDAVYCTDSLEDQITGLTIGNTYYLQVYTDTANSTETFDVCVSTNSIPGQTYVPDDNFEQALIDLGLDDTLDDYVVTANIIGVTNLSIRNLGISDLTGIEDFAGLQFLNCGLNLLGELDLSNNTNLTSLIADNAALVSLNMKNGNNTNVVTFITLGNVDLACVQVDDAAYSTANWTLIESGTSFSEFCGNPIQVAAKVYLQGATLNITDGFMRTDLKDNGYISQTSPYADGMTMSAEVFNATGQSRIVDWIWVELRDASNPAMVIAGTSAALRRDGDIVDAMASDSSTPVSFSREPGDYYIVIKHRNHLGIMSDGALTLSNTTLTTVDFTDRNNQLTFGSNAQTNFGMPADIVGMWCGNVNGDAVIQYSGTTPDAPAILSTVLNDVGNFLNFPTYTVAGYNANDVNMDGSTQYTGTTPDTPFILQNILAHPGNFLNFSTYQIREQLPENE